MASMYDKVWKWSDAKKRRQLTAVRPRLGAASYGAVTANGCIGRLRMTEFSVAAALAHACGVKHRNNYALSAAHAV